MLKGAVRELRAGNTSRLATDIGPIISDEAAKTIGAHVAAMRKKGFKVDALPLGEEASKGSFVAPTIIELDAAKSLGREVFGPVLHVLRYRRDEIDQLIDGINNTGYGLTFGLHTRLDETIDYVTSRVKAGNLYINRNTIGAVVGVQPFGGRGLSGTGPKAGGPLYLHRLVRSSEPKLAREEAELIGPVGERNSYGLHPRGRILCWSKSAAGLAEQKSFVAQTGNEAVVVEKGWEGKGPFAGALLEAEGEELRAQLEILAALPGPIVLAQAKPYNAAWLMEEQSISVNTTAAGGNANLMTIG